MNRDLSSIIYRLVELRKARGLTQLNVAEKANISFRTYQRIEAGEIAPRTDTLCEIVRSISDNPQVFFDEIFVEHSTCPCIIDNHGVEELTKSQSQLNLNVPMLAKLEDINGIKRILLNDFQRCTADIGYWEWNLTTGQWYWSDQMFMIYDIAIDDPNRNKTFSLRITMDDFERINEGMLLLVKQNLTYQNTHRVVTPSGRYSVQSTAKKNISELGQTIVYGIAEKLPESRE